MALTGIDVGQHLGACLVKSVQTDPNNARQSEQDVGLEECFKKVQEVWRHTWIMDRLFAGMT